MKSHALLFVSLLAAASCNSEITGLEPPSNPATETFASSLGIDFSQMKQMSVGVYYKDLVVGSGPLVTDSAVSVNVTYAGYLKDGKLFDSGSNVSFSLPALIQGFHVGMTGTKEEERMKEGGKRRLVIPSELGYGRRSQRGTDGTINIPRQSTLIFDVEVLKVTNPTPTT